MIVISRPPGVVARPWCWTPITADHAPSRENLQGRQMCHPSMKVSTSLGGLPSLATQAMLAAHFQPSVDFHG